MRILLAHVPCAVLWLSGNCPPAWAQAAAAPPTPSAPSAAPPPAGPAPQARAPGAAGSIPVPREILTARRAFISNGGVRCNWFVGPDRAYRLFYQAMRQWGRYRLARSPANATLAFEISFACPSGSADVIQGNSTETPYRPRLKLLIKDIATRVVLWSMAEPVRVALLQSNRDKNFRRAMDRLVARLQHLDRELPAAERRPVHRSHWASGRLALFLIGAAAFFILGIVELHRVRKLQSNFPQPAQPTPQFP